MFHSDARRPLQFNFFRTSGDIGASWGRVYGNLQSVISHQPWDNASAVRTGPGCWAYPDMLGKAHGHKPVLVKALHLMRFPLHHSRGFHSFSHLTLTRIWIRRGKTHCRGGEPTVVRGGQSALWRLGDRLRAANLGARPRQVRQRVFLRCHFFGIKNATISPRQARDTQRERAQKESGIFLSPATKSTTRSGRSSPTKPRSGSLRASRRASACTQVAWCARGSRQRPPRPRVSS